MSHLKYFDYPNFGTRSKQEINYSQAVRVDNRIEISGQGGWDPLTEAIPTDLGAEVDQAFSNVALALKQAGGTGWDQVYKTRIFVVMRDGLTFDDIAAHVVKNFKTLCPEHGPLLTFIEVKGLYKEMRIEIEAVAHLG